uniref:Uncharacterized protein n=1 Tax=viral metagenome TaxID=1070528 RepID=A0A6M3LFA7_9ZZZZ
MTIVKCAQCGDTMGTTLWTPESNICGSCADDLRDRANMMAMTKAIQDDMPDDIEAYRNEKAEEMP